MHTFPLRPTQAVTANVAVPQPYASVGLLYCGLSTSKAGTFAITFTVANRNSGRVSVQRTVVVQPECESGEQMCGDGTCGEEFLSATCADSLVLPLLYCNVTPSPH